MVKNFEELQQLGKDNVDAAVKTFGAASKTAQTIAVEMTDYTRKSFEQGSQAVEKLFGAKTLEKAIEVQTDYAKTAYEGLIAEAAKLGDLYTDLAKECCKPYEGLFAKVAPAK